LKLLCQGFYILKTYLLRSKMSSLKQTQNFLKLREKSKKKYDISVFSLLPRELIAKCMIPAMWRQKKEYRRWLDDIRIDSEIYKGIPRICLFFKETQKKTMMKCIVQTELLKKRRRHPPIRGKNKKN